jgi:hypothetical protein
MKLRSLFALTLLSLAACAAEPEASETTGTTRSAIIKGTESDASQDAVVLIMHYDKLKEGGSTAAGCTGILLTPRLVLTARHCVAVTDSGAACDGDGKAISGGVVQGDHRASALFVFTGKDRPDFLSGTAQKNVREGQEIITTGASTLCNNDIALVLLKNAVDNPKIAPIRLDDGPKKGEGITAVGWGITETTESPAVRMQRTGLKILEVGPKTDLGNTEFRLGEATCSGDSGGPAIAASGAVLGVLSRGGNGTGGAGAENCIDGYNIYTSAAGHADVIRSAYEKAGQEPWIEGGPNPLLGKLGASCSGHEACQSNICNLGANVCTQDCTTSACPGGWSCGKQGDQKVCVKDADDGGGGCSASGTSSRTSASVVLVLLALCSCVSARRSRNASRACGSPR